MAVRSTDIGTGTWLASSFIARVETVSSQQSEKPLQRKRENRHRISIGDERFWALRPFRTQQAGRRSLQTPKRKPLRFYLSTPSE